MRPVLLCFVTLFLLTTLCPTMAQAGDAAGFVLKGRILDPQGNPVAGAEVFAYDSARTRRPADFISPKTDRDGIYRIDLPAGRYWIVARVRGDERYGPLKPTGRHSGEAQEIEGATGVESVLDLTVAEVREMARNHRKTDEECHRVAGLILDQDGKPVRNAYAFARKNKSDASLPDYISPWSDGDGGYALCLPPGKFFLGASTTYPPVDGVPEMELFVSATEIAIANNIRINYTTPKKDEENQGNKEID